MHRFVIVLIFSFFFPPFTKFTSLSINLNTLCELSPTINLLHIYSKVTPTIIYALICEDKSGFKKGEKVEVLQDVSNGKHYKVASASLCTWVHGYNLEFISPSNSIPLPLYPNELEAYINSYDNYSNTPYFIWVDLSRQTTYIFTGSNKDWCFSKSITCATGKPTTSTIRGTFLISDRGEFLHSKECAKYWVRFYENYLFHSCPTDELGNIIDNRLGTPISNGCIRMNELDAKWFFTTIPSDTTVWIY